MKYILSIVLFLSIAFAGQSQTALDSSISVSVTRETLWIYGSYMRQSPNWDSRKIPDDVNAAIGNTKYTSPDSVVTFTFKKGRQLANFIKYIQTKGIAAYSDFYRKVYLGNPAIVGYTGLKAQLNTMALLNTQQGRTAAAIKAETIDGSNAQEATFTEDALMGIDWIKN